MGKNRGFLILSKIIVPPNSSARITNHPHTMTSLLVDSGAVYLENDPGKHSLSGGPIPLEHGPIVVHNPGDAPAVVFAALAHEDDDLYSVICLEETNDTTLAQNLSDGESYMFAKNHNRDNKGHHAFTQLQSGPAARRPDHRVDQ